VTLVAANSSNIPAKVGILNSCQLAHSSGTALQLSGLTDTIREPFFLDIPANNVPIRETIAFRGALPPEAGTAALSCSSVGWMGGNPVQTGPPHTSIQVPNIQIKEK
jgi:hypothetical protein